MAVFLASSPPSFNRAFETVSLRTYTYEYDNYYHLNIHVNNIIILEQPNPLASLKNYLSGYAHT